ncbi:MAG: uridine kinase [Xenococcaceae cyanobacterium MO_167.B27]|nr:uridine kinase [Xenococcaceae cyanobacterium MO_167.B27]
MITTRELRELTDLVLGRKNSKDCKSLIVAISGIDGLGKGYVAKKLSEELRGRGISVFVENLDGWLNLPEVRLSGDNPAENFYYNGFRFDELRNKLLQPYRENHRVRCNVRYIEESWQDFEIKELAIDLVDVFILEGIFIFQMDLVSFFDLKIWIDCTFETALERAITRNQEGLPPQETINAYQTIYFLAQQLHFIRDEPKKTADIRFLNDERLES